METFLYRLLFCIDMSFKDITKQALDEHKTLNLAKERKNIKQIISKIDSFLKKKKVKAKIKLGGSAAKETFLGNDFDIDIFIMFDYKTYLEADISTILGDCLKPLKPVKIHGSRDYYQIKTRYEIIPVLQIKNPKDAINVTDASTLHVDWVKKKLKKRPKLKDDIKLAKLFFKSIGVYGAESYIKGISGHVTDILVIHYGSFNKLMQAIAKWKDHHEIDIEKHKTILDKAKIQGPLIIVDPIQPNRNAAAALNNEKYAILKKKAKEFIKSPSIEYFREKCIDIKDLKQKYNFILKTLPKKGKIDIIGAKLMKGFEFMKNNLTDFGIIRSEWVWDRENNCYYCFLIEKKHLPKTYEKTGPSKEYPAHVEKFKKLYKNTYTKKGIIYARAKRDLTDIKDIIKSLSKDDYLKNKIRLIKII